MKTKELDPRSAMMVASWLTQRKWEW